MQAAEIRRRAASLGTWFHNIDLGGVPTAPGHPLGDYPAVTWRHVAPLLPSDLSGASVLDIGCNGGFHAIAMKRRGAASVVAIDADARYLAQARFAAEVTGQDIEFHHMDVYDVARLGRRFDIVLFMGVLYHLRHPLLALDLIHAHVAGGLLVFQSMQRGSTAIADVAPDYGFDARHPFDDPGWPLLHLVEHRYAGDPTNWWIPNRAGAEALLRVAGFDIAAQPEAETYLCRRGAATPGACAYPARGPASA